MITPPAATTWFGVVTAPGRRLLTAAIGVLVIAVTVLSVMVPTAASWLTVAGGLTAIWWYSHMMIAYRTANNQAPR